MRPWTSSRRRCRRLTPHTAYALSIFVSSNMYFILGFITLTHFCSPLPLSNSVHVDSDLCRFHNYIILCLNHLELRRRVSSELFSHITFSLGGKLFLVDYLPTIEPVFFHSASIMTVVTIGASMSFHEKHNYSSRHLSNASFS
ncbi:hypothetical protein F5880DRAFT_978779 [Lentinula raphanica]|nr:hypothetical protein F5880DRAFT_978779 [Lentinula raphanica]